MIGFSQTAGDARAFAARHRYQIDVNQESLAQGVANVGSGLLQAIPVSTSLSASSLNNETGARSPLASLTTGGIVILTMLFLAPLFSQLPQAVLAAIIIEAVVMGMMDVPAMRRLFRVKRFDFWIAVAALFGALELGGAGWRRHRHRPVDRLAGLLSATPAMPELVRQRGTEVFRSTDDARGGEAVPGLLVLGFDAGLFFIDANALEDRVRRLALEADPAAVVVLDLEGVNYIDSQGSEKIGDILELTRYDIRATAPGARQAGGHGSPASRRGSRQRWRAERLREHLRGDEGRRPVD